MLVVLYTLGAIATMLLLALALIGLRYLTRGTPVSASARRSIVAMAPSV